MRVEIQNVQSSFGKLNIDASSSTWNIIFSHRRRRDELISRILACYNLHASEIEPLQPSNSTRHETVENYNFRIVLSEPATNESFTSRPHRACATRLRQGVSDLVLRIANPSSRDSSGPRRVENSVAAMHIARTALGRCSPSLAHLVPAVYAWHATKPELEFEAGGPHCFPEPSWILMECRPGVVLDEHFSGMASPQRAHITAQVARVFAILQTARLPPTIDLYGSFGISAAGEVISTSPPHISGGPWSAYSKYWSARLRCRLQLADANPLLMGWRPNGVRACLERFIKEGVSVTLHSAKVDQRQLAFVHGDFSTSNILFDPETDTLTAILDFDYATASHPADEFFYSLADMGGSSHAHSDDWELRAQVLTGCFEDPSDFEDDDQLRDARLLARDWDRNLAFEGAIRPSDIQGICALEALRSLEDAILPFRMGSPAFLAHQTVVDKAHHRREAERVLISLMGWWGLPAFECT